jgi:hypothetical protein
MRVVVVIDCYNEGSYWLDMWNAMQSCFFILDPLSSGGLIIIRRFNTLKKEV